MTDQRDDTSTAEEFGAHLRQRRRRAMLTQEMLAELAGVDARTIREIETGRTRRPRATTMRLLLAALPDNATTAPVRRSADTIVPRELPPDTGGFVGRVGEIIRLDRLLDSHLDSAVAVVTGMAGVGKTALAIHWAHRAASEFPDGQLYVNLRGYDPATPADPTDVLAAFLRSLGVATAEIPDSLDERANRYRSLLANRRTLILLDNARSTDQVRDLMPGSATSVALVTSRDSLGGLTVRHGADHLELVPMPLDDARTLLRTHIGSRVADDPHGADVLVEQCVRLPLALRVAAQLATARPSLTLADLTAELSSEEERLDVLDAGDAHNSVEAVLSWTYRHLSESAAELFRLLGANPCREIDTTAVAALLGVGPRHARKLLAIQVTAHLVQETAVNRYCMHDLLHAYAARLAGQDPPDVRDAALTRLLNHYTLAAAAAMDIAAPYEKLRRPLPELPGHHVPAFPSRDAALSWLDTERTNLIALARHAADRGQPDAAAHLSTILYRYLDNRAHYSDAVILHSAAIETTNPDLRGRAMANYGVVLWRAGRYVDAKTHYEKTLPLLKATDDHCFVAGVIGNLGLTCWRLGQDAEALTHFLRSVAMFRQLESESPAFEARTLNNLAVLYQYMGRLDEAYDNHMRAIHLVQQTDDDEKANILNNFATTCHLLGRHEEALDHHRHALSTFRKVRNRRDETQALNDIGSVLCDTGSPTAAIAHHREALRYAQELDDHFEQARAHDGIARAHHQLGDDDLARTHWHTALTLHTAMSTPQAQEIARTLRRLRDPA
jgi:tetratricopeptide (TPR) repeat protein/DNA-binding XRE family transcriptional regulator